MPRAPYESDTTKMLRDLLEKKPQILEERRKGRSMWWDRRIDLDDLERQRAAKVAQKPYVYQTD